MVSVANDKGKNRKASRSDAIIPSYPFQQSYFSSHTEEKRFALKKKLNQILLT